MDCTTIISIIGLAVAVIGLNIPLVTAHKKTGWSNLYKGVGLSFGDELNPKPHPTTDQVDSEKGYWGYENTYGITIKNRLFSKVEIILTTVTIFNSNISPIKYRGRWWDSLSERLYRINPSNDEHKIELGAFSEKDLVTISKHFEGI